MKAYLTILIAICTCTVFGQVIVTPAGPVDIKNAVHYGGYLQNNTVINDKSKIIWYPNVSLYRLCGKYDKLQAVSPGYSYVDEECNCAEAFPYRLAAAAIAPYSNIQFEFDSSVLRTSSYPVLDAVSADLRATGVRCQLLGFASSEGTAAHNLRLSKDRANSVKTYLVNSGVDPHKLTIRAFGETKPIADNSTEEGRVQNRRVEFKK